MHTRTLAPLNFLPFILVTCAFAWGTQLRKEKVVEGPEAFFLDREGKLPLESLLPAIIQTKAKGDDLVTAMADAELSKLGSDVVTKGASAALMAIPGASIPIMMTSGQLVKMLPKFIHNPVLTFVYALPHGRSSNVIASTSPRFEVRFADITGADPDDFQAGIVKLTSTKNNWRLLGLKQAKQSAFDSSERTEYSFKEELIGTRVSKIARGIFEIAPARPLAPGEYGIVIRPVSESYKVSPKDTVIKAGEGLLLLPIWDFSVDTRER